MPVRVDIQTSSPPQFTVTSTLTKAQINSTMGFSVFKDPVYPIHAFMVNVTLDLVFTNPKIISEGTMLIFYGVLNVTSNVKLTQSFIGNINVTTFGKVLQLLIINGQVANLNRMLLKGINLNLIDYIPGWSFNNLILIVNQGYIELQSDISYLAH